MRSICASTKTNILLRWRILARNIKTLPATRNFGEEERVIISCTKKLTELGKAGELNKALKLFEEMPQRNQVSWNAMLTVLIQSNQLDKARRLFYQEMPHCNSRSYTLMITGLSRFGFVDEARKLFDSVPIQETNVVLWTAMLSCYTHNQKPLVGLKLFVSSYGHFFELLVIPNAHTLTVVLKACLDVWSLVTAMQIHGLAIKILDGESKDSVFVQNSLIDLHAKLGDLGDAEKIFNGIKWKDLSSWNIVMDAYTRHMLIDKAHGMFKAMGEKDTLSYNIMISGFAESGFGVDALEMFLHLLKLQSYVKVKPNSSTYTIVLSICATFTMLRFGVQIHASLFKCGILPGNIYIDNSLISMYARCGCIEETEQLFSDMPKRDVVSWNTLIVALGQNGCARKALEVAEQVLKLGFYNGNTFIGLLTSCSHGGLVEKGMEYLRSMSSEYGIQPSIDHYNCVIDMLGRAGRIAEAYDLLRKMPLAPNDVTWAAILSASVVHSNKEIGEIAARELQVLDPFNAANYMMLAKIYGCTGQTKKLWQTLGLMSKIGSKKGRGCSWILE
ncbi:Pentatricopeptide repeat-containing protein [Thalictrum thalictroides]|uniref:Pentatricopeptide repeat-containing protein n=1 Tax=Thalictrum thalictroides TaxID=46969 RepID=A0A7J6WUT3_THATH|nr:Pentatricopeptide repeat-containing protein [Thalictrum thalictroides]